MFKRKNKKGVFGLTAVQSFFAIILGIALLAYIIVVIMGTLGGTTILQKSSSTYVNDSVAPVTAGVSLTCASLSAGACGTITGVRNSSGYSLNAANYSQTNCLFSNLTSTAVYGTTWKVDYPCSSNSVNQDNLNSILTNTSSGISGFFSNITPVYAILAVLVIILVLVVLVRVVQAPSSTSGKGEQL